MKELLELVNEIKYRNAVAYDENFIVTKPLNTWDMNYRLYDEKEEKVYLIDVSDVCSNLEELEEYGGILFDDLLNLNIEEMKDMAWKVEDGTL